MRTIDQFIRVVTPPNSFFWTDETTPALTMEQLKREILLLQQTSQCPSNCSYCGAKKGQLPPFQFTFPNFENTLPWADQLVATRCHITTTQHIPSSIEYHCNEYCVTAYGYSQQDFWISCLAPLMKRVQLSSLPNFLLDWSHVQVLELHGKFRTGGSSSSMASTSGNDDGDGDATYQNLFTQSEAEILRTILVSSTCQLFHLELCWCVMDHTAGMFWDAVAQCPTLTILTMKDCDLSAETPSRPVVSPTSDTLLLSSKTRSTTIQNSKSGSLEELTIQGCHVDENSMDTLCQLLQNGTPSSLQQVTMINNDWPIDAGFKVASSLMHHTQLRSLDFTGLDAESSTIQGIGQLIKTSSSLQKLNLSQFPQVIDVRPLADGFMLLELDLSNNRLIHMDELTMALEANANLHTLNLSKTTIENGNDDDDSTHDDGDSTSENSTIDSPTFLVKLGNTRGLQVLVFDDVELSTESMNGLAQSLRTNTSLEALHLNNILVGATVSWKSLFESLHDNTTLRTLKIGQNQFDEKDLKAFVEALCVNRSLRSVTLSGCDLVDDDLVLLGERLSEMKGLEDLDLSFNSFGTKGVMGLCQGLASNIKLQQVSLFDSAWNVGGQKTISCEGYAKENEMIQELLKRNRASTLNPS